MGALTMKKNKSDYEMMVFYADKLRKQGKIVIIKYSNHVEKADEGNLNSVKRKDTKSPSLPQQQIRFNELIDENTNEDGDLLLGASEVKEVFRLAFIPVPREDERTSCSSTKPIAGLAEHKRGSDPKTNSSSGKQDFNIRTVMSKEKIDFLNERNKQDKAKELNKRFFNSDFGTTQDKYKTTQEIIGELGISTNRHNSDIIRDFTKEWISKEDHEKEVKELKEQNQELSTLLKLQVKDYKELQILFKKKKVRK